MLENYINKKVAIEEKRYDVSTFKNSVLPTRIEGVITSIDEDFIEIDNKMLISRKFIYRISII